jgi:hypothetical protein
MTDCASRLRPVFWDHACRRDHLVAHHPTAPNLGLGFIDRCPCRSRSLLGRRAALAWISSWSQRSLRCQSRICEKARVCQGGLPDRRRSDHCEAGQAGSGNAGRAEAMGRPHRPLPFRWLGIRVRHRSRARGNRKNVLAFGPDGALGISRGGEGNSYRLGDAARQGPPSLRRHSVCLLRLDRPTSQGTTEDRPNNGICRYTKYLTLELSGADDGTGQGRDVALREFSRSA